MKRYAEERKQAILKRMMPPENTPVPVLAEETGISDVTGMPATRIIGANKPERVVYQATTEDTNSVHLLPAQRDAQRNFRYRR